MARQNDSTRAQERAWSYYGYPGSKNAAVGEVGYVVDWRADQMTRLEWDVFVDGSPSWRIELPKKPDGTDGGVITTTDDDGDEDQTGASAKLLELIGWDDTNIRSIDTNNFVAGKGDYADFGKDGWRVVSTIEPDRRETLKAARDVVPFIVPHPANPKVPNPPLYRILDLLEALEWLTRQSSTQSKQRVLTSGIVVTADTLAGPNGESFWDMWNTTLSARMANPDDLSPVRLQAPTQDVKDGSVDWVLPPFGYDDVLDRKITAAIERLGWGLPVPPEILIGMQAQSRATAFQVEESAYRAHIEPPAKLIAQVAEDALNKVLENVTVKVVPNPTLMLARKQSVEDVKWARENGLVTPEYTREVMGIPEDAAPDPEIDGVPISAPSSSQRDPANVAADEPIAAAASTPNLSDLLADIDARLSYELAGFTVAATDRARQRLGAAARSNENVRGNPDLKAMKSAELAHQLGVDGLTAAGVDVPTQIAEPIDAATRWWVKRVGQVWEQMSVLVPAWRGEGDWVEESVTKLADALGAHIVQSLHLPDPGPLDAGSIRDVLNAAAGGGVH